MSQVYIDVKMSLCTAKLYDFGVCSGMWYVTSANLDQTGRNYLNSNAHCFTYKASLMYTCV